MINSKAIAKAVKELAKSERVLTRRLGNRVYLCNGYYAVYMNVGVYNEYVRPVSAKFPDLPNEDCGSKCLFSDALPTVSPDFMRIESVFEACSKASANVVDSGYLRTFRGEKRRAKVLMVDDQMIFIDEKIFDVCTAFSYVDEPSLFTEAKGNGNAPVYSVTDEMGFLMLPIRQMNNAFVVKAS